MRTTRNLLLLLLCLCSSCIALAAVTFQSSDLEWQLRHGDSPVAADGSLIWTGEQSSTSPPSPDWERTEVTTFQRPSGENVIWLRTAVPAAVPANSSLYLEFVDQAFEVYVGRERIYQFGDIQREGPFLGYPWHVIRLPALSAERTLLFRIRSHHVNIGLGPVKIGDTLAISLDMMRSDLSEIAIPFLLLVMGLVALSIPLFLRGGREFLSFGFVLLATSLGLFSRTHVKLLLVDAPALWMQLGIYSIYLNVPALIMFYNSIAVRRKVLDFIIIVDFVYAVGAIVFSSVGLVPAMATLLPYQYLILVSAFLFVTDVGIQSVRGSADARLFGVGLAVLTLAFALDVLQSMRIMPQWFKTTSWGFLAFAAFSAALLVRRVLRMHRLLKEYAADIERKKEELRLQVAEVTFLQSFSEALVNLKTLSELVETMTRSLQSFLGELFVVNVSCEEKGMPELKQPLPPEGKNLLYSVPLERKATGLQHGFLQVFGGNREVDFVRYRPVLDTVNHDCAMALESLLSIQEGLRKAAAEGQLKTAQALQEHFLARPCPQVSGWDLASAIQVAASLGGDWYKVVHDEQGNCLRFYVADVTGHGAASALVASASIAVVGSYENEVSGGRRQFNAVEILTLLNGTVTEIGLGEYMMTALVVEVKLATGDIMVHSAAHNLPALVGNAVSTHRAKKGITLHWKLLPLTGNRLGFVDVPEIGKVSARIEGDTLLVLYTDGIIEAESENARQFGERRFFEKIFSCREQPAEAIVRGVFQELATFRGQGELADDATLIVLKKASCAL